MLHIGHTDRFDRPTSLQDADILTPFPNSTENTDFRDAGFTNHIFRLRQLQSEVADVMYQRTVPYQDQFVPNLQSRLDMWLAQAPQYPQHSYLANWLNHAYHNLCMFLHRPSVARPFPSSTDVQRCFEASSAVLRLYWEMHQSNSMDCTWMTIHWLFLAGVTHLYCIWVDEDIRNSLDWTITYRDTHSAGMVLSSLAERLRSAQKMPRIYHDLCAGTFRKYGEMYPQSDDE